MANKNTVQLDDTIVFELQYGVEVNGTRHYECEMREMTGVDEEAITKPDVRGNIGKIITTLLAGTTIRIGDLTPQSVGGRAKWENLVRGMFTGDRDKMMLKLRELGHGKELELNFECPYCEQGIQHFVELDKDIEQKELVGDPNNLPVELERGFRDEAGDLHKEAKIRLVTGDDQEQLDAIAQRNPGQANTMLLTRCLVELGTVKVNSNTTRNLTTKDRQHLISQIKELNFGPNLELNIPCPHCSKEVKQGVHPINFL